MRRTFIICIFGSLLLVLSSCEKDDTKPVTDPTIQFRTDSGFTYQNDTVGLNDTLKVGVMIDRGTNALHHLKVTVSYDDGPTAVTDSLPLGTDEFQMDKVIITRAQAGSERWRFEVTENDGDVIRRALTFTVVE